MRLLLLAVISVSLLACSTGCDFQTQAAQNNTEDSGHQQSPRGVAILDLDGVAKRLGRDLEMDKTIKDKGNSVNVELASQQAFYRNDFAETQRRYGERPTEQQTLELQKKQQLMVAALQNAKREAEIEIQQLKTQLITRFREEVIPVARKVAAESGRDIVVTKNTTVIFAFTPEADITDRVVEKMLARTPAPRQTISPPPQPTNPLVPATPRKYAPEGELQQLPRQGDLRQP